MTPAAPSGQRGSRFTGDLATIGATMLMGSSYPFAKEVLATMSPLLYSASRYVVAGLVLLAVLFVMRRPMAVPRRDWLALIGLALIGVALFQACWGLAMARTAPSLGSIIMTTTTAFSAILAWLGGRRLPALGWLGIVSAFAGVVLVVNNSLDEITLAHADLNGALLWLLAAFAWALYVERCAPHNARLGALRVWAWTTLIGALLLLPVSLLFDRPSEFANLDTRLALYWLYTGIFPVGVAYLGLTVGLDRLGVSRVMVYMYLIPVAGVGLSAAFFGDPLTLARVLGGLIVLVGVILTRVALDRGARVPV
ncbi:MAG: DMT family transporter [Reyranella sp.]|uniref:DMT family transporter n=1 Tax=Reyranella sp. TaxID=1929291 RepID=UPI002731BD24|nr:DMT family transporter [Reyranella sp.]MDP1967362.1 DMT family transporter [Reyranella sp.]MDP2376119.1 DMT family transporter [Reyranella sp.]